MGRTATERKKYQVFSFRKYVCIKCKEKFEGEALV
jgi:hypothetical protein